METKTIATLDGETVLQVQTTTTLTKEQLEKTHYENSTKLDQKIIQQRNLELQLETVNKEIEELTAKKLESLQELEAVLPEIDRTLPKELSFNPIKAEPKPAVEMPAPDFTNLK